jgi:hypothetical protein
MKSRLMLPIALILGIGLIPLSSCANVSAAVTALTTSTAAPAAVTTLADAEQSATLVTQAVDLYVKTGNPTKATLQQLQAYSNAVHAALTTLEQANAEGGTLVFASFNAAVAAFNSYSASIGATK